MMHISMLLRSVEAEVRILAFGLLLASPASNALVQPEVLDCIQRNFVYIHEDCDSHDRGELLSLTRRLLKRLHDSEVAMLRTNNPDSEPILKHYRLFRKQYYAFLEDELGITSSYPRHILALACLHILIDFSGSSEVSSDLELLGALLNLVFDPFEDVRSSATSLLQTLLPRNSRSAKLLLHDDLLVRVRDLALRSDRADHADAMGHVLALRESSTYLSDPGGGSEAHSALSDDVSWLSKLTSPSGGSKLEPGNDLPIHGVLTGIYYRIRDLCQGQDAYQLWLEVIELSYNVWKQVEPQLCIDSPERANEAEQDNGGEGPKDLLSYSWRVLRDSR
jgi:hypothetical protein